VGCRVCECRAEQRESQLYIVRDFSASPIDAFRDVHEFFEELQVIGQQEPQQFKIARQVCGGYVHLDYQFVAVEQIVTSDVMSAQPCHHYSACAIRNRLDESHIGCGEPVEWDRRADDFVRGLDVCHLDFLG
jgi:hypothetical protein